ncbi:MAG: L,D-transpeptidase family protein, partial [Elusimicrobiales bacterium]
MKNIILSLALSGLTGFVYAGGHGSRRYAPELGSQPPSSNSRRESFCSRPDWLNGITQNGSGFGDLDDVDRIVVRKDRKEMYFFHFDDGKVELLKTYKVALGFHPEGDKGKEGDGRTPEGIYTITEKLGEAKYKHSKKAGGSDYHRALKLSYPDSGDIAAARRRGVRPGGEIMIHGFPNKKKLKRALRGDLSGFTERERRQFAFENPMNLVHPYYNWTTGCIAVTDAEIEKIYKAVSKGTLVEICPM